MLDTLTDYDILRLVEIRSRLKRNMDASRYPEIKMILFNAMRAITLGMDALGIILEDNDSGTTWSKKP